MTEFCLKKEGIEVKKCIKVNVQRERELKEVNYSLLK